MKHRVRWISAFCAFAAVLCAFALFRAKRTVQPGAADGLMSDYPLCVARLPKSEWDRGEVVSEAIVLALARAMDDETHRSFRTALTEAADAWEVRANPLVEDLGDENPDASLDAWVAHAPAEATIAKKALQGRYCANDGLCVEPVLADGACPRGFAKPTTSADARRASFLALPYGYARTIPRTSNERARLVARKLDHSRHHALVVDVDPRSSTDERTAELEGVVRRYQAAKAVAHARSHTGGEVPRMSDVNAHRNERVLYVDASKLLLIPSASVLTDAEGWNREVAELARESL